MPFKAPARGFRGGHAENGGDDGDDDDDDEFGDLLTDDFPGDAIEESLSKIEESFQTQRQQSVPGRYGTTQRDEGGRDSAIVVGSSSSTGGRPQKSNNNRKRSEKTAGVDDFRVSHAGQIQGGSRLPAGDDSFDDDDDEENNNGGGMWKEMDLDRVENDAIELSQRSQRSQQGGTGGGDREGMGVRTNGRSVSPLKTMSRPPKRARTEGAAAAIAEGPAVRRSAQEERETTVKQEIDADRKRIEILERQLLMKEEEIARFKKENQMKIGEVSVLRANMNKTVADFSTILREKEEAIAMQKSITAEMKKMHEEQMARSETINAFKHTELATTAHWSSVSASVARRRGTAGGGGLHSSQRGMGGGSQSQIAAAAAGLTTPTKRNRGTSSRNLGSGGVGTSDDRSGGADRSSRSGGDHGGEESPSSRRKNVLQQQQQQQRLASAARTKPKTPAFPGFVNSFAGKGAAAQTPGSVSAAKSKKAARGLENMPDDDDAAVFLDNNPSSPPVIRVDQGIDPASSLAGPSSKESSEVARAGWSNTQLRYLWAVTVYAKRLGFLSSLILSHSSPPCSAGGPTGASSSHVQTNSTTLYRLLNAALPAEMPLHLQEQYAVTTHMLLNMLTHGSATDAEERFAYLLEPFDYDEEEGIDEVIKEKAQEETFWACYSLMDEGINNVLVGIASALCTMMEICIEAGLVERVYDVFIMTKAICIHHPSMLHAILTTTRPAQIREVQGDDGYQGREASADNDSRELDISKMIIVSVKRLTSKADSGTGVEPKAWKVDAKTGEKILQAVLELVSIMAYEDAFSLICTHKLRHIIDTPGVFASLIEHTSRSSKTIRQALLIAIRLAQHPTLWRNILGCKSDKSKGDAAQRRANNALSSTPDSPLLEMLATLIIKGKVSMDAREAHGVHADIVTLYTQLAIHQSDALVLLAESNTTLAAVISCLQTDAGLIWNDEGEEIQSREDMQVIDIVERICMDIRLLCQLYIYPKRPTNLAKKLQSHEAHLTLNGIKHCFILAVSRIAFAPEPDYFDAKASQLLGTVNENAADLLELVLSPEEMESAWEMLNGEDEEEEEGDDNGQEDQEMKEYLPPIPSDEAAEAEVDSQTQMDEDGREFIVIS